MNNNGRLAAIGVDVGGTKIAAGIVSYPSGEVAYPITIPTCPDRGGEAVLESVAGLIRSLLAQAHSNEIRVQGAGIGVAELVDAEGNVTSEQTIAWAHLPVCKRLAELCPVKVESDVRAAALGEAIFGAGRRFQLFVYVTAGTGISSCLVQERRPFAGARGNALVMGSSPLTTICTGCGMRLQPILEEVASGPAIARRYGARGQAPGDVRAKGPLGAELVFKAWAEGDSFAAQILREAGIALGVSVAFLANVLDPEAIVVGGGLGTASGPLWDAMVDAAREHIWSPCTRKLPLLKAELGPHSGVIGSAAKFFPIEQAAEKGIST